MVKNLNMTRGHPGKLILTFALPLMVGNIFQQLYTVVDTAIVGRGVGMDALAALGTVDWLNWMYLGIVAGFAQGFSVLMAQKYGEGDLPGLRKVIGNSARLCIIIAVALLAFGQLSLPIFLDLLRVPGELRYMAALFFRIIVAGVPATMFFNFCAGVLRSIGDSQTPLRAMAAASVTNIALDCIAVFVLHWGIAGVAIATVLSQCLSGALCWVKIRKTQIIRFTREDMQKDRHLIGRLMGLGVPVTIQNTIISVGGMAVTSVVNRFDTAFIAGYVATNKLYGVLEMASLSYGHAVTTYTGQNYGACAWDRIRKGVSWAVVISLATSVLIGGAMILFGREITMLFISSDSAEAMAAAGNVAYRYLFIMSSMLPVLYLLYAYRSALQGMGNTTIPLVSGLIEFFVRVGSAVLISFTLWQDGIFFAEVGAWLGATILLAAAYYHKAAKLDK